MPREIDGLKVCSKCRVEKPVSEFKKLLKSVDGLNYSCKECDKAYADAHREHLRELDRKSYYKNREKRIAKSSKWKYVKKGLSVPQKILDMLGVGKKRPSHESAREKELARIRKWKASNKDNVSLSNYIYSQTEEGRRVNRLKSHRYKAKKNSLPNTLTRNDILFLLEFQEGRCGNCQKPFSKNFPYELDHIVPVDLGGGLTLENTQLLCRSCNASKCNKSIRYIPELPNEILWKETQT